MRYKLFGNTGLRVSEACLGTMTFGDDWGWGANRQESERMFRTFAECGGNFIDTASNYTNGSSETLLGDFLGTERNRFVLATKYTLSSQPNDPNASGNHRKNMMNSLERSLKRLKTDHVDLYWVHAWDGITPIEEVMRGLDDLVAAGKVLYVGVSDAPAWVTARANTLAEFRGWSKFAGVQIEYSLLERTCEREIVPMARALNLCVTAWSPLGGGLLTGKYRRDGKTIKTQGDTRYAPGEKGFSEAVLNERNLRIAEEVSKVAQETNFSPAQVAICWLRQQGNDIVPILGARKLEQLEDNLKAFQLSLPDEHVRRLSAASSVELGFPHDFLKTSMIRELVFGKSFDLIDKPEGIRP